MLPVAVQTLAPLPLETQSYSGLKPVEQWLPAPLPGAVQMNPPAPS
jgi:hypothetical protein